MGCEGSTELLKPQNVKIQFRQLQLDYLLDDCQFTSDLELQIFMTINVVRKAPSFFVDNILFTKRTHKLCANATNTDDLIHTMSIMDPLEPLLYNQLANDACVKNNLSKQDSAIPQPGGNKQFMPMYQCEEYTVANYDKDSAIEFVALALILNWSRPSKSSPILAEEVQSIGISAMAHKKTVNLI